MENNSCNTDKFKISPKHGHCEFDHFPPAMAYVPWQHFQTVYEIDMALCKGTIFPELEKPFLGKAGVCV